jgi:hypothetical protein
MNDIKGYFRLTSYWKQLPVLSFVSGSFHIGKDYLYTFSSAFIIIGARLAYILSELKKLRGWNIASFLVDTDNMKTLRHAPRQNVWSNGGCVSYFNDNNRRDSIHWAWTIFYTGSRLRSSRTNDYIPKQ